MKIKNGNNSEYFHSAIPSGMEGSFIDPASINDTGTLVHLWPTMFFLRKIKTEKASWHIALNNDIISATEKGDRSFKGDWRKSDFMTWKSPAAAAFRTFLADSVRRRIAMSLGESANFTWQWNGWVNLKSGFEWHQPHIHEKSTLSFVYYLEAPPPLDQRVLRTSVLEGGPIGGMIQFQDPRGAAPYMSCELVDNVHSSVVRLVPLSGLLIIFPSYISHLVTPVSSTERRISIAGNIFRIEARGKR